MERVEAADPDRRLAGLDHMFKGEDRLKEKIAERLRYNPDWTSKQALEEVPDTVRFTLAYSNNDYTAGVRTDVDRLKAEGFELVKLKNLWAKEQYKGINSQWRVPESGAHFEVQFHTPTGFQAKELTHGAYERLRNPATSADEEVQLEDFSGERTHGSRFRRTYSRSKTTLRRDAMADELSYYAIVDEHTGLAAPLSVLRQFNTGDRRDESFGRDLEWKFSPSGTP